MNRFALVVGVFSVVLLGPVASSTVASTSFTTDAYAQAREVLDTALEASGGAEMQRVQGASGTGAQKTRSPLPQTPRRAAPSSISRTAGW